ncbi:dethiobiotin synthase [Vogesella indigofera]|uniref:dethiobiotin synthase n=1 Tax=Vogesella indigofera TaxID=45465 RepID=UPI00234C5443|nr:dethiobiotin synthase [Vogesella indigofera]MDC7705353.1 dethiobiotin synthase [Vogesella indigofera]
MAQGYFITGTDTEIGKTHSAVKLIRHWQAQGRCVLAMKPVASGCDILPDGSWHNDDVARLVAATGQTDLALMNPYRFLPPVSPHIAARDAGVTIDPALIVAHYQSLAADADVVLVEGAGGWLAPLSDTLDMQGLAQVLQLPVILVVGMKLGCINHALLTAQAIRASGCTLAGWVANRVVPAQLAFEDNLATLTRALGEPLLSLPYETPATPAA